MLEDTAISKDTYTEEYWKEDTEKVKDFAGEPIDVIFCGDDYDENSFWAKGYPEAETIFHQQKFEKTLLCTGSVCRVLSAHFIQRRFS